MRILNIRAGGQTSAVQGNLLEYAATNGLVRHSRHLSGNPKRKPGFLVAEHRPGALLLQQKTSPAIVATPYTSRDFFPSALFQAFPYGYFGDSNDNCLYHPNSLKMTPTDTASHYDYKVQWSARSGSSTMADGQITLTKAILDQCVNQLAVRANHGAGGTSQGVVFYSNRLALGKPRSPQSISLASHEPYYSDYGSFKRIVIGSSKMELGFTCETGHAGTSENRAILTFRWEDTGGILLAFPQGEPGTSITARLWAKRTHHPKRNYYISNNRSYNLAAGGQLAISLQALPVDGTFNNQWPEAIQLDPDSLGDMMGEAVYGDPIERTKQEFSSVTGRDGDYITQDGIYVGLVELVIPPSRLMLLFSTLPLAYINGVFWFEENIKKSLVIGSQFDSVFWEKSGDHTTINAAKWYQESDFEVEFSLDFVNL